MKISFKSLASLSLVVIFLAGCSSEFDPCACYKKALNLEDKSTLEQDCQELVEGMTNQVIQDSLDQCFVDDVSDLVGGGVL